MYNSQETPNSVLIIGSGVFGLATAYALANRKEYIEKKTKITLLDRLDFPAADASSIDSSRIIRADYADPSYAALMAEAHPAWQAEFGADGRYNEAGLCLVTDTVKDGNQPTRDGGSEEPEFIEKAMEVVTQRLGLKQGRKVDGGQVEALLGPNDIHRVFDDLGDSSGDNLGTKGYVNWTSGWADAEASMRHLRELAVQTGRISFRTGTVQRLHFDSSSSSTITSVSLTTGEHLTADLIVLATGAWTPGLLDLRGRASATGHLLAYLTLTETEQARLGANPTLINGSSGYFIITPRDRVLKVACHGWGYANPTRIAHPERNSSSNSSSDEAEAEPEEIDISLPRTHLSAHPVTPPRALTQARAFLARTFPSLADRPWTRTRMCWYTDTVSGDWIVAYHPRHANLFVATGGSGHAFKFLPVLGERVADVIGGRDRDALGAELRRKWAWPARRTEGDHVFTDDWRGGEKGLVLDDAS